METQKNMKQEHPVEIERRFYRTEARAQKADDGKMIIGGYGALLEKYTNMGWYAEVVMPGFFDDIKDDRAACLFNHESSQVLGRKKNSTLTLKVDESGLDYEAILPSHRADVFELIQDGYIYESSFAFTTKQASWAEIDRSELVGKLSETDLDSLSYNGKVTVRRLEKGRELFDVSPVTFAAYEGTTTDTRIAKRGFEAWKSEEKEKDSPLVPEKSKRARLLEAVERNT
jgi:HK97 family phage prohead protease